MRGTLALGVAALAVAWVGGAAPAPAGAVGTICTTGQSPVYDGCTWVVLVPGVYCSVGSGGTIAGIPYYVGPWRPC